MKQLDLTDKVFGELTVIGLSSISRNGHSRWHVICSCGKETTILGTHLVHAKQRSCGCLRKGHVNFKGHGLLPHTYYTDVKRRAKGGKGRRQVEFNVSIEEMWWQFERQKGLCNLSGIPINFYSKTASLDRIDSSKGYFPNNIQWLHKDINRMKWCHNEEYFIELCKKVRDKWAEQFR